MNDRANDFTQRSTLLTTNGGAEKFFRANNFFAEKMLHKNYKFVQLLASDTGCNVSPAQTTTTNVEAIAACDTNYRIATSDR